MTHNGLVQGQSYTMHVLLVSSSPIFFFALRPGVFELQPNFERTHNDSEHYGVKLPPCVCVINFPATFQMSLPFALGQTVVELQVTFRQLHRRTHNYLGHNKVKDVPYNVLLM